MINEDFSNKSKVQDVARWHVTSFVKKLSRELPSGLSVLDAGAGESVYKKYFHHCDYKAIDLAVGERGWNYNNLDYIAPLHNMPIEDDSIDVILCTQVLEHLEWPRESVREMCRVLKEDGKLYMTAPMSHPEHQEPYDYFRYTSYGLESICLKAGFRKVEIIAFGGMWTRWAYELPRCLSFIPNSGLFTGEYKLIGFVLLPIRLFLLGIIRIIQCVFLSLDKYDKKKTDPFGWACIATK